MTRFPVSFSPELANIHDAIKDYWAVVQEQLGDAEVREIDVAV